MKMLEPIERKFVLACKAINPQEAVLDVYRDNYYIAGASEATDWGHVQNILMKLVSKYLPTTTQHIIEQLHPVNDFKYNATTFDHRVAEVAITTIRHADVAFFPGITNTTESTND